MHKLIPAMMATVVLACAPLTASAQYATNFSYTFLGIEIGSADLEQQVLVDNEVYEELGVADIFGSYQFSDNAAVSFSSLAMSNSGNRTEITDTIATLSLHFPFQLNTVDLVPHIGWAGVEAEACSGNFCYSESFNSLTYGVDLRLWLVPNTLELGVGYTDYAEDELSRVVSLEAAMWAWERHRFSLSYYDREMSKTTTIGYRYNW
ncbi:hypothetical protein [Marinimicrobium alkaliphilum]|uniref:hypothetical protein n=1 Tax=Marinimicrobium alkaliphilum TaxID=2202654 RepID=UPI000DBA2532|nr:hypothetical protein [Marinimicrobium alkaliphilum]